MGIIKTVATANELQKLEVININTGKRLGNVFDVEFDLCLGSILAVHIPKKISIMEMFSKDAKKSYRIPWTSIDRIGDDAILVRVDEEYL